MRNILFVCGSLNQTTQMHAIAKNLMNKYLCYFTPYYADGIVNIFAKMNWLGFTVLGGRHKRETEEYLSCHALNVDLRGESRHYDLIITCSDLLIQKNILDSRIILVQEGITEPEGLMYQIVKKLKLPRYLANTATSGLSNQYDLFCVASEGYAELFVRKGVRPEKISVTGIPNFDNLESARPSAFPFRDYILVATSPLRETFRYDDRSSFIHKCKKIAAGRQMIFKLHPLENAERAIREIHKIAPESTVFTSGDINSMIANAEIVITQQSTCTFVALALGKQTYTNLDVAELKRLMPIQNGGASALQIANICERVLSMPIEELRPTQQNFHFPAQRKPSNIL